MKVKAVCINKNQAGQFFMLFNAKDNCPLYYTINRKWKTEKGALNWARNNGYLV